MYPLFPRVLTPRLRVTPQTYAPGNRDQKIKNGRQQQYVPQYGPGGGTDASSLPTFEFANTCVCLLFAPGTQVAIEKNELVGGGSG